ncbi:MULTISPECIES: ribonuclease catalytic domain-containing protein [unclassified Coleofasciculus]|uniref:ribonuclease catalytic domain-containing protein n=1 Tax=unclassified Coleofasciculus TaxID=2692782 RepID=UPI00187DEDDC|nr:MULTISPECIES: ribonuclease R family protein [unclassified Coleofasciculus]MBE9125887.1 VacB/RNase II family 3'-5' exoribonuclease [Coleofasciculus sp. LEGE 07081]MBE9149077.1 VacB/RNase II family 3'-5' exoribonuclease [Coleofasciculus sp. LEGE 07092]
MEKETLIEFRVHGDRRLATVDRPEGKKHWIVIDERGQSHTLHPRQVSYEVKGCTFKPSEIPEFLKEVEPYLDPSSLEVAWEILVEDSKAVTCAEMAQLLFSDQSPPLCYAAHCLLSDDKLYFKQKADTYEPRPAAKVAEIKHQQLAAESKQREQEEFLTRVQQKLHGEAVEWQDSDRVRIDILERFILHPENASRAAQDILALLDLPQTPQGAFDVLVDLGLWSPHENLFLRRSSFPVHFRREVLELAQQYLESPPPDPDQDRLDLTHLKVYTIDDESTEEIDDGLSLETLNDGVERLWIHIADPTRLVIPGDELDLEARRRSTTVYLPTGMIPMFPPALATGPMSLVEGQVCPALSFGVVLDEVGNVQDYSIHASVIKPTYRLTYEDVDEMLQLGIRAEPEIAAIAQWAKCRQKWRTSQGAIGIYMPEAVIKVRNEDEICIDVLEDSPARLMVAEMMILTGEVAGRYGQTHELPLPFRGQPQPEMPSEEELLQLPAGPVRFCAIRRCMPKSEMSITPIRHAGLGLGTYTQVTSPIRRYTDLLTHFQLKAHLRGDSLPFSAEYLQETMQGVTTAAAEATLVERQTNRYWGLEYLRRHSDQPWHALMLRWLREHDNLGLILLEDLGLELVMRFKRSIRPGDRLEVKVERSDPRQDVIQFRELVDQAVESAAT